MPKLLWPLLSLLVGLTAFLVYLHQIWPDQYVHVIFCDVGQGDGALITYKFTQVVIDGGPDSSILSCLSKHMPAWDREIEIVIATHGDLDHIGGILPILERYQVKKLFTIGYGKDSSSFETLRQSIITEKSQGMELIGGYAGQKFTIDGFISGLIVFPHFPIGDMNIYSNKFSETQLSALYTEQMTSYGSINNQSIALFLTIKDLVIFFPSDLEEHAELAMLNSLLLIDTHVLKVGHHGSKTSTTMAILEKLKPEFAIISLGKNNRYGHPHQQTIQHLHSIKAKIFRTDLLHTIEMVTDGHQLWWHFGE